MLKNIFQRVSVGVIISILLLLITNYAYSQTGLQGPFRPIGVEQTHINGSTSDVQMLFKATTIGGSDVYATGQSTMSQADVAGIFRDRANAPNGQTFKNLAEGAGHEVGGGTISSASTPDPSDYGNTGECMGTGGVTLTECWGIFVAQMATYPAWEEVDIVCHATNSGWVNLRFRTVGPPPGAPGVWGFWKYATTYPPCADRPGGTLDTPGSGAGDPISDSDLYNLAINNSGTTINNNNFYYNSNSSTINNSYGGSPTFSTTSNSLTISYGVATGTTAGSGGIPDGFAGEEGGGNGDPGIDGTPGSNDGDGFGGGGGSGGEGSGDVLCDIYPNAIACQEAEEGNASTILGLLPDLPDYSTDVGDAYAPVVVPGSSGCPSPVTETFLGATMEFTYQPMCDAAVVMNPMIILIATVLGLYILIGYKSAST